jgi:putative transcriptional regulator
MSRILESVHKSAARLRAAGAIDDLTMREYDALCLPERRKFSPEQIRQIRQATKASQPVFAAILGVGKTTVAQWEQGLKKPGGAALTLLNVVAENGLAPLMGRGKAAGTGVMRQPASARKRGKARRTA